MAKPIIEIYEDAVGKWRWNLKAPNGETIASSSQGYETRDDCLSRIHALGIFLPIATTSVASEVREQKVLGYTKQVFFSHSSDDEELVSLIRLAFQFTRVKPYFARLERAARNPADKIIREIDNSEALFALFTPNVFVKTETLFWVLFEAGIAKGNKKPVFAWVEETCNDVPQCVNYITDYERFRLDDFKSRDKVVREMVTIALGL